MNVDKIFDTFNRHRVSYLLLGGMNFLLRHAPIVTYDVDLWIEDTEENLGRCENALAELNAEWGPTEQDWEPVASKPAGWLGRQPVFCLTSRDGAIDIFRYVKGLDDWQASFKTANREQTASGIAYFGLSDDDMLRCQYALDENHRKRDRIAALEAALKNRGN
jgi:hypothetical protein